MFFFLHLLNETLLSWVWIERKRNFKPLHNSWKAHWRSNVLVINVVYRLILTGKTFPRRLLMRCLAGPDGRFPFLWPFPATEASTLPLSLRPGEQTGPSTPEDCLVCSPAACLCSPADVCLECSAALNLLCLSPGCFLWDPEKVSCPMRSAWSTLAATLPSQPCSSTSALDLKNTSHFFFCLRWLTDLFSSFRGPCLCCTWLYLTYSS